MLENTIAVDFNFITIIIIALSLTIISTLVISISTFFKSKKQ